MLRPSNDMLKELIIDVSAAFLALSALLVGFLTFHGYSLVAPENLFFFGILLAVSTALGLLIRFGGKFLKVGVAALLMMLLVDYQFPDLIGKDGANMAVLYLAAVFGVLFVLAWVLHKGVSRILIAVYATIIASTVLGNAFQGQPEAALAPDGQANKDLPPVIHIVLDEHIGVEGIPLSIDGGRETKEFLKDFYTSQGFALFGKAYSHYQKTVMSLGTLVALGQVPKGGNVKSTNEKRGVWGDAYSIKENPYFSLMKTRGYALNIYQNDFLDFCDPASGFSWTCTTYPCCKANMVAPLEMPAAHKTRVVAGAFLELFVTYKAIRKVYRYLFHIGLPIPYWEWERQFNAISGFDVLSRLKKEVGRAGNGQFYFAHSLLPHSPYVYGRECDVNPPDKWLARFSELAIEADRWRSDGKNIKNTPETRADRYTLYFEQTRCTHKIVGEIFQHLKDIGLFDKAIIVIHGDHGSRLPLIAPEATLKEPVSVADLVDSYSTFFAVKAPGIAPGYNLRRVAIQTLFADLVNGEPWKLSEAGAVEAASAKTLIIDSAGPGRKMIDFVENADYQP